MPDDWKHNIDIEDDSRTVTDATGRLTLDHVTWLSAEWLDQVAKGYRCLNCYQKFTSSYPDVCSFPGCGYPVKDQQRIDFSRLYAGDDKYMVTDAELRERGAEQAEQRLRTRGVWIP